MLTNYFADMHIHIGQDIYEKPVKITASRKLTITNILKEASRRKGIEMIGVIDCQAPAVQEEIHGLIEQGEAKELEDGGIRFENVTLIIGAEIEIYDENCLGPIHVLCYFPTLRAIEQFTQWLTPKMTNVTLSSQRYYGSAKDLQYKVKQLEGLFIPAHVFTPFKSVYGKGVKRSLTEVFDPDLIDGIELGLSSDTKMADQIKELHNYTYVTNSDSHSLAKIGREYQQMLLKEPSFKEFYYALHEVKGRKVSANYGMNPKLGKYYTTVCQHCMENISFGIVKCPHCQSKKVVNGVYDRIKQLQDTNETAANRPAYYYQVPLEYLPGLGPKTFERLIEHFETEMNIIHEVPFEKLTEIIQRKIAQMIIDMREGKQTIVAGGGGKYGSVLTE